MGGTNVGETSELVSIYGSPTEFNSTYFTLNHRGYFCPEVTGSYNFTPSGVDDIAFIWLGSNAYSGYTRANANLVADYVYAPGFNTTNHAMTAGTYVPFRIMFGQAQGAIVFRMTVQFPNSTTLLGASSPQSNDVSQYGCPAIMSSAPSYPAWSSET